LGIGWSESCFKQTQNVPYYCASSVSAQRVIEVTGPFTIKTDDFRFAEDYRGLEIIENAGTVIGWDGEQEVQTPYDNCVLIMPSRRLKKGESAVRFGCYVE